MFQIIIKDRLGANYDFFVEKEEDVSLMLKNIENFKFITDDIQIVPIPHKESKLDSRQLPLFLDITNKIIPLIKNIISGNPRGQLIVERMPLLTQAIYRAITTSMSKDDVISDLNDIFSLLEPQGVEKAEFNNISRIIIQNLYEKNLAEDAKAAGERNFEEKSEREGKSSDDKPDQVIGREKFTKEAIKEQIKEAVDERIRQIVVETISKELLANDSKVINLILNIAQEAVKEIIIGMPKKLVSQIGAQEILKMAQEISSEITKKIVEEIKIKKEIREEDQLALNESPAKGSSGLNESPAKGPSGLNESRQLLTSSGLFRQRSSNLVSQNENSMTLESSSPKI